MNDKLRRDIFTVIAVFFSLITLSATASWCSVSSEFYNILIEPDYIDGTDISQGVWIGVISYMMFSVLFWGALFVLVTVLTSVVWAVFGFNSINRYSEISLSDFMFSMKFFLISSAGMLAVAAVIVIIRAATLKSGIPFIALLYCWQNPLFMWLFYIRRLKKKQIA